MASWRDEYAQALRDRDEREKASYQRVDDELIAAYTELLNRTAVLEAEKAVNATTPITDIKPQNLSLSAIANAGVIDGPPQLKVELVEALRAKDHLQSRMKVAEAELTKLRAKTKHDARTIEDLTKDRTSLIRRLKDRDEELRGKTKLLDDVHDEVISLNLQLNMSEQRVKDLKTENKELIDRWMARKGREAEEMNKTLQEYSKG